MATSKEGERVAALKTASRSQRTGARSMKYVMVRWLHSQVDEPVTLYSELDDTSWELRKLEVYADGRADFADQQTRSGSTKLSIEPFPDLKQIATDPQFEPVLVSAEEFESVWSRAKISRPAP